MLVCMTLLQVNKQSCSCIILLCHIKVFFLLNLGGCSLCQKFGAESNCFYVFITRVVH